MQETPEIKIDDGVTAQEIELVEKYYRVLKDRPKSKHEYEKEYGASDCFENGARTGNIIYSTLNILEFLIPMVFVFGLVYLMDIYLIPLYSPLLFAITCGTLVAMAVNGSGCDFFLTGIFDNLVEKIPSIRAKRKIKTRTIEKLHQDHLVERELSMRLARIDISEILQRFNASSKTHSLHLTDKRMILTEKAKSDMVLKLKIIDRERESPSTGTKQYALTSLF